jgi:hypothetical protein
MTCNLLSVIRTFSVAFYCCSFVVSVRCPVAPAHKTLYDRKPCDNPVVHTFFL